MSIQSTVLDTTATTIYTSSGTSAVTVMYFCNTNPGALTFNIYAVPNGYSAGDTNIIYYAVQIAAQDTYVIDTERLLLDNGDSIVANCTIAGVIVSTVSYLGV
jgi:hypothetical protein